LRDCRAAPAAARGRRPRAQQSPGVANYSRVESAFTSRWRRGMEYRRLGASGLEVSALCLGTMMFGDRTDRADAEAIVAAAHEAGVNFIDTADVYAKGESERITGAAIAATRDRWILATKAGNAMRANERNNGGLSRR